MFLSGVTVTIGPKRTFKFFVKQQNIVGSICFVGGLTLVVFGWPFVGACVEFYGFLVLFSAFFPTVFLFLKRLPVVGTFFAVPGVKDLIARFAGTSQHSLPVWRMYGLIYESRNPFLTAHIYNYLHHARRLFLHLRLARFVWTETGTPMLLLHLAFIDVQSRVKTNAAANCCS